MLVLAVCLGLIAIIGVVKLRAPHPDVARYVEPWHIESVRKANCRNRAALVARDAKRAHRAKRARARINHHNARS